MPQNYLEVSIGKTLNVDPTDSNCYDFLRVDIKLGFSFDDSAFTIKDMHKRIGAELYPILVENINFNMAHFRSKLPGVVVNGETQPVKQAGPTPPAPIKK